MGYVGRRCGWFVDQRCDIGQCSVVGTLYRPPSAQTARADDHWRIQEEAPIWPTVLQYARLLAAWIATMCTFL